MIEIPLSKGYKTVIDDIDAPHVQEFKWSACERILRDEDGYTDGSLVDYAKRSHSGRRRKRSVYLHRQIAEQIVGHKLRKSQKVDHVNGDRLDNRRENLRVCGARLNTLNARAYGEVKLKGVCFDRSNGTYRARISLADGSRKSLGRFSDPYAAAWAYDREAMRLGLAIRLNSDILWAFIGLLFGGAR